MNRLLELNISFLFFFKSLTRYGCKVCIPTKFNICNDCGRWCGWGGRWPRDEHILDVKGQLVPASVACVLFSGKYQWQWQWQWLPWNMAHVTCMSFPSQMFPVHTFFTMHSSNSSVWPFGLSVRDVLIMVKAKYKLLKWKQKKTVHC